MNCSPSIKSNFSNIESLSKFFNELFYITVPDFVWDEYHLDQRINDRGILIDVGLVRQAISMDEIAQNELQNALKEITGLDNPNSVSQMKTWLSSNGLETDSLGKKQVTELIKTAPDNLKKVLIFGSGKSIS